MSRFRDLVVVLPAVLIIINTLISAPAPALACPGPIANYDDDGYWIPWETENDKQRELPPDFWSASEGHLTTFLTSSMEQLLEEGWRSRYMFGNFGFEAISTNNLPETQAILEDRADTILQWTLHEPGDWNVALMLRILSGTPVRPLAPVFREALNHPAGGVRAAAIKWFGAVKDPEAVKALESLWKDVDAWDRAKLMTALGQQQSHRHLKYAADLACGKAAEQHPVLRYSAVESMVYSESEKVVPCLVKILDSDDEASLRLVALGGVIEHRTDPKAGAALRRVAQREGDPLRYITLQRITEVDWNEAAHWLQEMADDPLEPPDIRILILNGLGRLVDEHIPLILEFLQDREHKSSFQAFRIATGYLQQAGIQRNEEELSEFSDRWIHIGYRPRKNSTRTYRIESRDDPPTIACHRFPDDPAPIILTDEMFKPFEQFKGDGDHWVFANPQKTNDPPMCWLRFGELVAVEE